MDKHLQAKVAKLEMVNDQLEAEIIELDVMMRKLGFSDGLFTLKETAKALIDSGIKLEEIDLG